MKKALFLSVMISLLIASCSKNSNDLTANWLGNYDVNGTGDTVNRIAVTKVNDNTLQMQLQVAYTHTSPFYTYVTLRNVGLTSASSSASIDEYDLISNRPDINHIVGSAAVSGNVLTVSATYTDTVTHLQRPYYFIGTR
jgi:hypothetical protein